MRDLPDVGEFDVVTCLGGTFGMFDDETNHHTLEEMASKLAPGGKLVLQMTNRDYLAPRMPCRSWWTGDHCMVLDEASFDGKSSRVVVKRTVVFEDGRQFEQQFSIRLYALHEVGRLFASVGMRIVDISGARQTPGMYYGSASPDLWVVAVRSK
jgi:SAM-dependent methyltransferase